MPKINRLRFANYLFLIALSIKAATALAQNSENTGTNEQTNYIVNGSFEEGVDNGDSLSPWFGQEGSLDTSESTDGKASLLVDTRESDLSKHLLNVCYDVPVKQFSFHLMIMGCLILAPELPRIMNLLFWNRATEP